LSKELNLRLRVLVAKYAKWIASQGQAMSDEQRDERLQIMLSPDELTVLDDFRFKQRMPSRAAAVRELLKRGLAGQGFSSAAFGTKSSDYGVLGKNTTDGKGTTEDKGRSASE
jgi:hypothetical protein